MLCGLQVQQPADWESVFSRCNLIHGQLLVSRLPLWVQPRFRPGSHPTALSFTGTISYGLYLLHKIPFDVVQSLRIDKYVAAFHFPFLEHFGEAIFEVEALL